MWDVSECKKDDDKARTHDVASIRGSQDSVPGKRSRCRWLPESLVARLVDDGTIVAETEAWLIPKLSAEALSR